MKYSEIEREAEQQSQEASLDALAEAVYQSTKMLPNRPRMWLSKFGSVGSLSHPIGNGFKTLFNDYKESLREAKSLVVPVVVSESFHSDCRHTTSIEGF